MGVILMSRCWVLTPAVWLVLALAPESGTAAEPRVSATGSLTLTAKAAQRHGPKIRVETRGKESNIGYWQSARAWVSWKFRCDLPGTYQLTGKLSANTHTADFRVEVAGQKLNGKAPKTGNWHRYRTVRIGSVKISKPGEYLLKVQPRNAKHWKGMNLVHLHLQKTS
jgi:hypothetical protein